MAKKNSLPSTVYVVRNADGDESFLLACISVQDAVIAADDSPAVVGTYELVYEAKYRQTTEEVK
jgi:hypothetical protein